MIRTRAPGQPDEGVGISDASYHVFSVEKRGGAVAFFIDGKKLRAVDRLALDSDDWRIEIKTADEFSPLGLDWIVLRKD